MFVVHVATEMLLFSLDIHLFHLLVFVTQEQTSVGQLLCKFNEAPDSLMRVSELLANSNSVNTQMIALVALENIVKVRWTVLSPQQKMQIKQFLGDRIALTAQQVRSAKSLNVLLKKMNLLLVQVRGNGGGGEGDSEQALVGC